ncbi:ribosomal RNA small subunit methyltransferase H [Oxobacter pfennigii]|uniref:Ribosomal RNA small subunit methyltransferase H n=1 Tax=Oxobacter pfennigii TaxID=36849 RepID=A0A0P8W7L6_9CLOT|nr:16S rRNA (cytosine(1402)-N(4))-methyltransferase RsmH [Oxobacter pfennigii]KPU44044.1 ribosomal RNA small subunit methyltransferase H [Oxobacter pfennigii]
MEFYHVSVLLKQSVENLVWKQDGIYVDGTVGGAGHSLEILKTLNSGGKLIGIDRDLTALKAAQEKLKNYKDRLLLIHSNFSNLKQVLEDNGIKKVDGVLLDIGVSSPQLDDAERGFSYNNDAPLDMRMDMTSELTAKEIINTYSENELSKIIYEYGEERWAKRIASFIVKEREKNKIITTGQLVEIIKNAIPASARREGPHPAKRTFQAIRIAVNRELDEITEAIPNIVDVLNPNGRVCIITFHSLEDRIVKDEFKRLANPCTCPPEFPVCICNNKPEINILTRKPILPDEDEIRENPRSRSAKLRVAQKL